jgi:2,3-bisphosphoglycerate-dependent phosphoglycerate mutase
MTASLVLVRHGQSEWNQKNLFTGWRDPDLTDQGIEEAHKAGLKLKSLNLDFDVMYTSNLLRAQRTGNIILDSLDSKGIPIIKMMLKRNGEKSRFIYGEGHLTSLLREAKA